MKAFEIRREPTLAVQHNPCHYAELRCYDDQVSQVLMQGSKSKYTRRTPLTLTELCNERSHTAKAQYYDSNEGPETHNFVNIAIVDNLPLE